MVIQNNKNINTVIGVKEKSANDDMGNQPDNKLKFGDMFGSSDDEEFKTKKELVKKFKSFEGTTLDDAEGFYILRTGDLLNSRYKTISLSGKGVFSSVFLVEDTKENTSVKRCVKIIRKNDVMYRTGLRELHVLKGMEKKDPKGTQNCVQFFESFMHEGHLCMVFEAMDMNLRQLMRKNGSKGFSLEVVRKFGRQLFEALAFIRRGELIHADVKPDNILVDRHRTRVKLCDFGSAFDSNSVSITPYLCSRYYRPPEIVMGNEYGFAVDVWSLGCVLFELFSGEILFRGSSNNAMLLLFMELLGPLPSKLLKNSAFYDDHFDSKGLFLLEKTDKVTGGKYRHACKVSDRIKKKDLLRKVMQKQRKNGSGIEGELNGAEDLNQVRSLENLIEKCLCLNPNKRITPSEALKHSFFTQNTQKSKLKNNR